VLVVQIVCSEPVKYLAQDMIQRDIANRRAALQDVPAGDCGFSSQTAYKSEVHPTVVWAMFQGMAEGTRLATTQLWV
jgi:hypothetical protein